MIELKRVCSISLYDSFAPRDNSYSALHENVASVKRYVLQRYYQGFFLIIDQESFVQRSLDFDCSLLNVN